MQPSPSSRLLLVLRSLVLSALFVSLWVWLAFVARGFDSRLTVRLPGWLGPFGLVIGLLGAGVVACCIGIFATRGHGTPTPLHPPRQLVVSGPFRVVRNPMYLGGAALLAGAGLTLRSPAIVLLAAGFLLIAHVFVLLHEERRLRGAFGASYVHYAQTVNRWLPQLRPRTLLLLVLIAAGMYLLITFLTGRAGYLDDTF